MELDAQTKIDDLLCAYPFLLDYLAELFLRFKALANPLMRRRITQDVTAIRGLQGEKRLLDWE